MKQYLNFADNGNYTRTEQAQYIFTEFVPTHRDNGSGGQIHRGTGKRQKSTACRTDRRCRSGKSTVRGYNAPCFAGVVHYFMGSGLKRRDNGTSGTKCGACYCSIPRYPCFSAFPSKYRKANAGIRSKSLPHFVL